MEIDQLLDDLARLHAAEGGGSSSPDVFQQFAVVSASSFAPDNVEIAAQTPRPDGKPTSILSVPAVASPYANPEVAKRELEKHTRPLFALENLSPYPTGSYVFPEPRPSRFLAQMPMSNARMELVPKRRGMVLDPFNLEYEFRAIDTTRTGVDAGFSSALTKQDEYARGKMTNKPFSPGGQSLVDLDGKDVIGLQGNGSVSFSSAKEQARDQLVLDEALDLEDYTMLEEIVMNAPGLNGSLTVGDVRTLEREKVVEAAPPRADANDGLEVVGTNPDGLLKPYFDVASDRDRVLAIRRIVEDEKATNAMVQVENESGTVALDQLLHDLEDDEDLNELGFLTEENNATSDPKPEGASESETGEAVAEKQVGGNEHTPSDGADTEPEEELEAILAAGSGMSKVVKQAIQPASEWASIASVDVRNFHEKVPEMAIKYGFELDTFQKECVLHLERHECVFVAAHTSAGKTVVAEYAIAMSQKHMTRTIYTSPIKALSNQKYRDFRTKFGPENVGLITGDVSINPDASCLVMTTEILRSMLYRGADVIRDIEWVIFDEIHYINDSERGVVWEEVIIMLPEHIGMVFLSATTPNHLEFSDWIGRTKKKKIHVISTTKRPVPLQHFLYAGKDLFKVYDASTGYLPGAYGAAKAKLFPPSDKPKAGGRGGGSSAGGSSNNPRTMGRTSGGDQSDWTKLITSLKDKSLLPVVVFAFSKKLCEESASKLSKLDLSSPSERSEIHLFLESSIQRLQGSDRELPQVLTMKEMLKRGIGVHHGGLLPIIKEMVEILFGRGLVKVLFSTETFAMGVNMPARTVVFNGIRKHDGKSFRDLLPGEYTQMAGRAGRRGLDLVGTVIISCWNDIPEPTSLQTMLAGKATSLSSQFRLTYNMILNLLRVEVLTVEDMMKRSFSEFQTQKALASKNIPQLIMRGRRLLKQLEAALHEEYPHLEASGELDRIRELYQMKKQKHDLEKKMTKWMLTKNAQAAKNAIAPGRVIVINAKGLPSDLLALVVRTNSNPLSSGPYGLALDDISLSDGRTSVHVTNPGLFKSITVICICPENYEPPAKPTSQPEENDSRLGNLRFGGRQLQGKKDDDMVGFMGGKKEASKNKDAKELESNTTDALLGMKYAVLDIPETCIEMVTNVQATNVNIKTLVASSSKKELASSVEFLMQLEKETAVTKKAALPYVDVVNELRINNLDAMTMYSKWEQLYQLVLTHPCSNDSGPLSRVMGKVDKISKLNDYVTRLTRELSNDSLSLFPDFQQRLKVLKRLDYISDDGVVQVKGRVACEINTCEEIVLTEMIFENVLANLEPEEIVAVLSALIFQEKTQSEPALTPRLEHVRETVKKIAESLGLIQLEQHLDIDPAVYCKGALNFGLMEVVYEWSRGMPFKELCLLTDIQEGSIVRCITRLDEVCREVRNAARVIGDPRLFRKMEVASESIKRDVVFASSLYLT
uniref:Helicase SKI2W n=1 Tax=Globisporangium ultimum (strain ATCC 200006 / CBS 805.95 / DAOM BR144) TaxID=431595 RepID=K3WVU5_GLOUD